MTRAGKTELGSHEYEVVAGVTACLMGNNVWCLFRAGVDLGLDFKTLAAARRWAKKNIAEQPA